MERCQCILGRRKIVLRTYDVAVFFFLRRREIFLRCREMSLRRDIYDVLNDVVSLRRREILYDVVTITTS